MVIQFFLFVFFFSYWSRLRNWIGPGTWPQSSKPLKNVQKNIAFADIYQLTKFGGLMSSGSKQEVCDVLTRKWTPSQLLFKNVLNIWRTPSFLFYSFSELTSKWTPSHLKKTRFQHHLYFLTCFWCTLWSLW